MKLPNYKILTGISVMDIPYESDYQFSKECAKLVTEQDEILKLNDIYWETNYKIHFFDSPYSDDDIDNMSYDEAIQCLAIKDGYDLVQFENGNYGYVAYYNGVENGFEILGESEEDE